jgi:hypothetical protein
MKLTKETQNVVKEIARKHNLNEFKFFRALVKNAMYRAALKDKEFVRLAKQVDSSMEKMKKKIKDMEARGEKVPDLYRMLAKGQR